MSSFQNTLCQRKRIRCPLPSLTDNLNWVIRSQKFKWNEEPLCLVIEHSTRTFKVKLKLSESDNGMPISFRHLADVVYEETGVPAFRQKYYYKGYSWSDPNMGPWSPSLRSLGIKNGDKIQMVTVNPSYADWEAMVELNAIVKESEITRNQVSALFRRLDELQRGYHGLGDEIKALGLLKKQFENLKSKLMYEIQAANKLKFDHRNALFQAKRREVMDNAQRSMDKCTEMTSCIFHKLAQSQYLGNGGSLFP